LVGKEEAEAEAEAKEEAEDQYKLLQKCTVMPEKINLDIRF
jgi:hypothetical protein